MSPSPQLAPPGSSTYSSDTMYVGDGTWDSTRNSFLLPNLLGLNFETMRYNGMGNRFRDMPGYKSIIRGHGVIGAIVFLLLVPAAIVIAKFYDRNPRLALRLHIWLQIITVFLVTAVFALGWLAVGPARSLTNPHHGIGLTLYVLILLQVIGGALIHRTEKGRDRLRIPLKLFLHQWVGRCIALLGFIQVALGLTLYGSPKTLFILYALWGFALLVAYLTLSFLHRPAIRLDYDDGESYVTGYYSEATSGRQRQRHNKLKYLAAAGAAGAGLAAMRRRSRSRRGSRDDSRVDVISSRHSSPSRRHSGHYGNEKYSDHNYGKQGTSWKDRILGTAAGVGAIAGISRLLGRRNRDRDSDVGDYRPPLGGAHSFTHTDVSRVEEGRAPESPDERWRRVEEREHAQAAAMAAGSPSKQRPKPRPHRSGDSVDSFDSRSSFSDRLRPSKNYTVREGIAALGVAGYLRHKMKERRERKEELRIDDIRRQDVETERIARTNGHGHRYTGDGTPRRGGRRGSETATSVGLTGSTPELSRHNLPATANAHSSTINVVTTTTADPVLPTPPPIGSHREDSGSEAYLSAGGTQRRRHHAAQNAAAAATAAAAAVPGPSTAVHEAHRDSSRQRSSNGDSLASPPVSVKVKMHNDGRHVTLRRLNEEEAAAEREARRRERRKNRANSLSSQSGVGEDRWRRTAPANPDTSTSVTPVPAPPPPMQKQDDELHLPPPPPIPAASSAIGGSISSPPGTNTDVTSNYDSNRRRRRAERAAAKQARGGGGSRVEFT